MSTATYAMKDDAALGAVVSANGWNDIAQLVDNQLAWLYTQLMSNGVLSGWTLTASSTLYVAPGEGAVNGAHCKTTGASAITGLTSGTTNYVYAVQKVAEVGRVSSSYTQALVTFEANTSGVTPSGGILIATGVVDAGGTQFTSVNNTPNGRVNLYTLQNEFATRVYEIWGEWVVTGLQPATATGLTSDISAGVAYVRGTRVVKLSATSHEYTASQDTYVDISSTGTFTFSAVNNDDPAPAVAGSSIRLAKVVTDSSDITSVTDLRNTSPAYTFRDGAVTSDALADDVLESRHFGDGSVPMGALAPDAVGPTELATGLEADEVSARDIPIRDDGALLDAGDVEQAIAELATEKLNLTGGVLTGPLGLTEQVADPAGVEDRGYIYTKADGSDTELFYADDDGVATKITLDGEVYAPSKLPLAGGTMSGDIAMGTHKLTGLAAGAAAGESLRYEQVRIPFGAHRWSGLQPAPGTTTYFSVISNRDGASTGTTTEANIQWKAYTALTFANLRVYLGTNTADYATTWTLRDDAADTALSISIGAGVTGALEDTDTVAMAAGSLVAIKCVCAAGTVGLVPSIHTWQVEAYCG